MNLLDLKGEITFVVGSGKGVGKTTFMNYLAGILRSEGPVLITSVGVDGEKLDALTFEPKPAIRVELGDYVVTTMPALDQSSASFSIVHVLSRGTTLGQLVLAKAARGGTVEIIGPQTNQYLSESLKLVIRESGIKTVLVDGAINRVTQAASLANAGFFEVECVTPASRQASINRIKMLSLMSEALTPYPNAEDDDGVYSCIGALTKDRLQQVPRKAHTLLLEDFTKIFVDWRAIKPYQLLFKSTFRLRGVVLNFRDVASAAFMREVSNEKISSRLIINPYLNEKEER